MYRPYKRPASRAFSALKAPEPRFSGAITLLAGLLGRSYLMVFLGVFRIILRGGEYLFPVFQRALRGESRCILAFRHPNGGEPQLLAWFFLFKLRRLACRAGFRLARRPRLIFVYGYEVLRWGGWAARLVMPRLGALPIHHAKIDSPGMARIYQTVFEGPYPLAIAPEGQVSYSAERVLRLEPGPVRIGFHAAERLAEGGRPCPVELLPVSVQYRYGPLGKLGLYLLLRRVERAAGLKGQGSSLRERFRRCRESILAANEERYGLKAGDLSFEERLDRVIGAALEQAERILGVRGGEEEFFARLYRLRQICWDRIFLPEAGSLEGFSPVQRGILDLRAGEAWHAGRHLELADFAWYFRGPLPEDEGPLHIQVEYVQNLWDFASRSRGGAYSSRVNIPVRRAIIQTGPPLNLTERLGDYQRDRKAAVARALEDLKNRYLASAGTVSPAAKED